MLKIPVAREGLPLVILLAVGAIVAFGLGQIIIGSVFALIFAALSFFFRDPERVPPKDANCVVSPADGRVLNCEKLPDGSHNLAVFLSLWDVHINRAPTDGVVENMRHMPGKFVPAFKKEAGRVNEQNRITLSTPLGTLTVTQIAGILARRVVCYLKPGDSVARGERLGLILFGSRVDCTLPPNILPCVGAGEYLRGGESIIGVAKNEKDCHAPPKADSAMTKEGKNGKN